MLCDFMDEDSTKKLIKNYIRQKCREYKNNKLLPLMLPTFSSEEIFEAFDSMISLNLTMGAKVKKFENDFSAYIGTKHSCMVNSGSSANLLALTVLSNPTIPNHIKRGDEIIVPAVTWSTTIFPIINIGAKPILVDIDEDYLVDIEKIKEMISDRSRAIMPVHLLGNVCDMGAITEIAEDYGLFVVEDTCEALGSEYKGKKVGTFSTFSTFSFYFSHHITTIEGGMLCTNNFDYADLARIMRAHGYIRDSFKKDKFVEQYPYIDPRYLFVNIGYNIRPTDLQGAFGIQQLKKLENFLIVRTKAARKILKRVEQYSDYLLLPREKEETRHSWFAFPITVKENKYFNKNDLVGHLEKNGIETRPIVGGNISEQPAMNLFDHKNSDLSRAKYIMKNSFYFGIHPFIKDETIKRIADVFDSFFAFVKK